MDRSDTAHRAGGPGAAPTLAFGRSGAAGSDSGSVGSSSPPTCCTLTAEAQSTKQYPPPSARCCNGWGLPQHGEGEQNLCRSQCYGARQWNLTPAANGPSGGRSLGSVCYKR
eukprot:3494468-Rhodomonas_salina.1